MNALSKWLNLSERIISILCVISLAIMAVMGILQVFFRYVIASSLTFSEELTIFMFIWSVALGSAIALRKGSHAAIELFVNWLPAKLKKAVLIFGILLSVAFFLLLIIKGIDLTQTVHKQLSPAMQIPMSYAYSAIPTGGLFMLIYSLEQLYKLLSTPKP